MNPLVYMTTMKKPKQCYEPSGTPLLGKEQLLTTAYSESAEDRRAGDAPESPNQDPKDGEQGKVAIGGGRHGRAKEHIRSSP